MNVYFPDSIERVLRVLERREELVLRKLAREPHALIERLGSKRNQCVDGLTTQKTCVVKLDLK